MIDILTLIDAKPLYIQCVLILKYIVGDMNGNFKNQRDFWKSINIAGGNFYGNFNDKNISKRASGNTF